MTSDDARENTRATVRKSDVSLPRTAILRGRNVFASVFNSGSGVRAGRIVVKYSIAPVVGRATAAGFVMRRGSGNAVTRNRLKRLMREAYRLERSEFESRLPDGVTLHLVIMWSGTPDEAKRERLDRVRADVVGAFRKIVHRLRSRPTDTPRQ